MIKNHNCPTIRQILIIISNLDRFQYCPTQQPSPQIETPIIMTIESEVAENLSRNDASKEEEFWLFGYG